MSAIVRQAAPIMPGMSLLRVLPLAPALIALAACTPALNWREVPLPPTSAVALLPCKPDHAERTVPLGGAPTVLSVTGCEAGGDCADKKCTETTFHLVPVEVVWIVSARIRTVGS